MTNYFLSPLGSKKWLPSNLNGRGSGAHPVSKQASFGQSLVREDISAAGAGAARDQFQGTRKSYQYGPGKSCDTSDFRVQYQDPLAALASGKYASTNLAVTVPISSNSPASFHEFASVGDYLMSSVDSLVGAASPQHNDLSLRFIKSHEADTIYEELDTVVAQGGGAGAAAGGGGGPGASGFEMSRNICGNDERIVILAQLLDPEPKQAAAAAAADAGKIGLQHDERMEPLKVLAQTRLKSSRGDKFDDSLREHVKEVKALFRYQKLRDGILDQDKVEGVVKLQQEPASYEKQQGRASAGMNSLWPHEEPCDKGRSNSWSNHPCDSVSLARFSRDLKRDSHEDESVFKLLREAAGCQGGGLFEAAVKNVRDGHARDIHLNSGTLKELSGQNLHSSIGHCSSYRKHKLAFPEAVAMGSVRNRAPWPRTNELRALEEWLAAPLQTPPVQDFPEMRDSSSSSRNTAAETHDSGCHETLKWLGAAGNYRSPDPIAESTLQRKSVAGRDLAHDDLFALHASNTCPSKNTVAKKYPSSSPSSSPSISLAQDPFQSQISCSTPLNETPAAENQMLTPGSFSETNGLTQITNTEQSSPYLEVAASKTKPMINPSLSRELQTMEDTRKTAVSETKLARKRSRSHANEQLRDSDEFPSSKKQEVVTEPCSNSTSSELECNSSVPGIAPACTDKVSVRSATPDVATVPAMEVEDWINLLTAGLEGERDGYTRRDDAFVPMEINAAPQSPLSDFTGGMAMLFDYM